MSRKITIVIEDGDYEPNFISTSPLVNLQHFPSNTTIEQLEDNPCEKCPSNPKYQMYMVGGVHAGDSPCQWCRYSPTRVTD